MSNTHLGRSAAILTAVGLACLLGIGIGIGWTAAVVIVVVGVLVWLGYQLACQSLSGDRERVTRERAALDAEWEALDRTQRIRETFFDARVAMRQEAQRYWPTNGPRGDGQ